MCKVGKLSFGYIVHGADALSAVECGVLAEKSGFDVLWVTDHFVDVWPDGDRLEPWTTLSAVAALTSRIRLGSAVTDTQRSHPARTAQAAACLDVLSRGRAILGIGAGEAMNIVPYGLPWDSPKERIARLEEAIQVIRALWTSSRERPASYSGQFYRLDKAVLDQLPKQTLPIYVGAFASERALSVVGRFGDGWYPWLNTPETFRKRWSVVKEAAQSVGRSVKRIEPVAQVLVAFPRSAKEERDALTRAKATLVAEKTLLRSLGYTPNTDQYQNLVHPFRDDVSKIMKAIREVPDEIVYKTMAIGGLSEVNDRINELVSAGARQIAIFDLMGLKTAKRTFSLLRKIITE